MPLQKCTLPNGKSGTKWGESGKCYESRDDAIKQMRAIKWSQEHAALTAEEIEFIEATYTENSVDTMTAVDDHIIAAYLASDTNRMYDGAKPSETKARIQCVHFAKSMFTLEQAKAWLTKMGLSSDVVESSDKISWNAKQQELTATSKYRTTRFSQGINVTLQSM